LIDQIFHSIQPISPKERREQNLSSRILVGGGMQDNRELLSRRLGRCC